MTNKEIIIDGVNVAECESHSSTPSSELCYMKGNKCNDNPNCYYKQLQRLTAKYSELEKELLFARTEVSKKVEYIQEQREIIMQKQRECEEYKIKVRYIHSFLRNKYNYGTFRPMWGAYLLKHLFNEDLADFFDDKAYKMADTIEEKETELARVTAQYNAVVEQNKSLQMELKQKYKLENLRDREGFDDLIRGTFLYRRAL